MSNNGTFVAVDQLGELRTDPSGSNSAAFRELRARVDEAGLLRSRPVYYTIKIGYTLGAFFGGWAMMFYLGESWLQLLVAAFLGFWAMQVGLIAHDSSHRQIARQLRINSIIGYIHGNLLLGMSYGWWVRHHTQHHAEPNHLDRDPDIRRRKAIFVPSQAYERTGFSRFVAKNQGWVFFPLKLLEAIGLRSSSLRAIRNGEVDNPRLESALLILHAVAFLGTIFAVLPLTLGLLFLLVHQLVFGFYLGISFATNHKGMPTRRDNGEWTWLERQILTARNLRPSRVADFIYGGLNYQIEHHLFPTMPRPNLRRAIPIVKAFCEENGIHYEETGVMESYVHVTRSLGRVSRQVDWSEPNRPTPVEGV